MSDTSDTNPRAGIGGNFPPLARSIAAEEGDFAAVVTAFLQEEYAKWPGIIEGLLDEARAIPKVIEDDATKSKTASIIKRLRDTAKSLDAFHGKEKSPYLRGGQACDQWFYGWIDKLARRSKTSNPGAADVLLSRLTDYDNRVLAAEQARRRREAEEAAEAARKAQAAAAEELRIAEEARLAAERARKPERIEEKTALAKEADVRVDAAKVEAVVTSARAEDAHIATLAKAADIMRTRGVDGTLSTMAQEKYAEIVDRSKLDLAKLAPFIPLAALQTALNGWAKSTDYREPMDGASIGRRNRSAVR